MMRLKRANESPPGGFQFIEKSSGFKVHGWSLKSVGAQWYQEQLRRGKKTTLERCCNEVETFTCSQLMNGQGWENFVEITSEVTEEEYVDKYDRDQSSPQTNDLFTVVFPFCAKDGLMAARLMEWIVKLTPPTDHPLLISHDRGTPL